jgi:hypothetical protein
MVRKWTEDGGGGEKREKQARRVAEFQRGCYHDSTVPVKEKLEVIEGEEDSFGTENPHLRKPSVEHPKFFLSY